MPNVYPQTKPIPTGYKYSNSVAVRTMAFVAVALALVDAALLYVLFTR